MKFTMQTAMGPMHGEVDANGALKRLAFGAGPAGPPPHALQQQIDEYFASRREAFDLPLAPEGTPFQQRVWRALCEIPYGTTLSYGELAARLGSSSRAVGRANATNPIALIVPCHRVIGRDGSLTGYAFGIELKRRLLDLEAANCLVDSAGSATPITRPIPTAAVARA
ncbi:MAG: methylated-DNA--[protein]-cysteine S-methyltransferase [Candidatus Xenobia bacterium]